MLDCVLVVVAYRSAADVAGLLATVPAAVAGLSWAAVVVNNDPGDDLTAVLAPHPRAELVEAGANLGYAAGLNLGVRSAPRSRYLLFLNPDLRLAPGSVARLVAGAGEQDAAVPLIRDETGAVHRSLRREPSISRAAGEALLGDRWPGRPGWLAELVRSPASYRHPHAVDWATGAALLVPAGLVRRVGPWDSARFFLYSEETDYCRRLRRAGARVVFVPGALVRHRGGGSGSSVGLVALREVNRLRYYEKWHSRAPAAAFAGVLVLHCALRWRRPESRTALRALLWPRARAALPRGDR